MENYDAAKKEINAEMARVKRVWVSRYPDEDWELAVYASWHLAKREWINWRRVATLLAILNAALVGYVVALLGRGA